MKCLTVRISSYVLDCAIAELLPTQQKLPAKTNTSSQEEHPEINGSGLAMCGVLFDGFFWGGINQK